jgi:hypothetical protein
MAMVKPTPPIHRVVHHRESVVSRRQLTSQYWELSKALEVFVLLKPTVELGDTCSNAFEDTVEGKCSLPCFPLLLPLLLLFFGSNHVVESLFTMLEVIILFLVQSFKEGPISIVFKVLPILLQTHAVTKYEYMHCRQQLVHRNAMAARWHVIGTSITYCDTYSYLALFPSIYIISLARCGCC